MRISDWSSDVCSSDLRFVQVAADRLRVGRGGLFGQKAFQIVAFASQLGTHRFRRRPGVLDARLGRRRHAVHFLDPDRPFLVHPKILSTRARPSISAATSSPLLYNTKLDRAVAAPPPCPPDSK